MFFHIFFVFIKSVSVPIFQHIILFDNCCADIFNQLCVFSMCGNIFITNNLITFIIIINCCFVINKEYISRITIPLRINNHHKLRFIKIAKVWPFVNSHAIVAIPFHSIFFLLTHHWPINIRINSVIIGRWTTHLFQEGIVVKQLIFEKVINVCFHKNLSCYFRIYSSKRVFVVNFVFIYWI